MATIREIAGQLAKVVDGVKERVTQLIKQYRSLANYGRPYFESIHEVAVIYYLNAKLGIGLNDIAEYLGVDKTSLYKLVKRIESEHRVAITNPQTKKVEVVEVTPDQLINIVEAEILQVTAKQKITDPFMSSIIKEFWEKPIQRQANIGRRAYYNEKEKLEAIKVVRELMQVALENNLPSNPDFWDKETLLRLIDIAYSNVDRRVKRAKIKC
jgi:hypothetical protein